MKLNQVDIFVEQTLKPDLVITYTLGKNKEIDMFKIWISPKQNKSIEILNYANLLFYKIIVSNEREKPLEQDIFVTYQYILGKELVMPYKTKQTSVNIAQTLLKAPYNAYKELNGKYIRERIETLRKSYIDKYNKKEG